MADWTLWLASWWPVPPLNRRGREVLLNILYHPTLEFRVAWLLYQIKHM